MNNIMIKIVITIIIINVLTTIIIIIILYIHQMELVEWCEVRGLQELNDCPHLLIHSHLIVIIVISIAISIVIMCLSGSLSLPLFLSLSLSDQNLLLRCWCVRAGCIISAIGVPRDRWAGYSHHTNHDKMTIMGP